LSLQKTVTLAIDITT